MAKAPTANKKPFKCFLKSTKIGIAASSLKELQDVGCKALKITKSDLKHTELEDGTIVGSDEYFKSLPPNTVIRFVRQSLAKDTSLAEVTESILQAFQVLTLLPRNRVIEAIENPSDKLKDSEHPQYIEMLQVLSKKFNIEEEREKDPDWFRDVKGKAKTKSKVMGNLAETRMRNYLSSVRNHVKKANLEEHVRSLLNNKLNEFQKRLSNDSWHRHYFVREIWRQDAFCDSTGRFRCEGSHNTEGCIYYHTINPYWSWEAKRVFSTWELDHKIERSREIIPRMIEAAKSDRSNMVNWNYFYELLFTRTNLRLVHVACHDKKMHNLLCETAKVYLVSAANA